MKELDVKYIGLKGKVKKQTLTDEQFEELVQMQLKNRAIRREVTDRCARLGDEILFDYAGFLGEEQFPGGTAEKQTLLLGSNAFIPGFEEQCVGRGSGENFDVNVKFPEQYPAPMLAGQDSVFHCKIHAIYTEEVPELTDEFVKKTSECNSVEEYRMTLKEEAQKALDNQSKLEIRDELMHAMVDTVDIEVSKEVINSELDVMMSELEDQLTVSGFSIDQYTQQTGQSREYLRASMLNDAIYRVRLNIVLEYIADKEGISISDEEIEEVIEIAAAQYNMTTEDVRNSIGEIGLEGFKQDLLRQKTENFILDHADIEEE